MSKIAREYSTWDLWTSGRDRSQVAIVKVRAGQTIRVGNEVGFMKDRKVEKDFQFITSKIHREPLTSDDIKAKGVRAELSRAHCPIDCSIFASKLATYHGVKFPSWISVAWTHSDFFTDINQDTVEEVVNSVLMNAVKDKVKEPKIDMSALGKIKVHMKTFVLTGKGPDVRDTIVRKINGKGGRVINKMDRYADYLVTNDKSSTSAKARAAASYGIEVITYDELYAGLK